MFSIKDFFRKVGIWSHLLKKSLMENFIFVQGLGLLRLKVILRKNISKPLRASVKFQPAFSENSQI